MQWHRGWLSSSASLPLRTNLARGRADQGGGPSGVKVGPLGSLMRPARDLRDPVCLEVGTPCLPCRGQGSLQGLGGDIHIASGMVRMNSLHVCNLCINVAKIVYYAKLLSL